MDHVLFLDIEVNRKGKIVDYGAIFKNQELHAPNHYELILSHKEINLNSQKYPRALGIINGLSTGDQLQGDRLMFGNNEASGLALKGKGNMLLFSKRFVQKKLSSFKSNGYKLVSARVEYLVYWYDKDEDKEYQVVLPRLRFEQDK